MPVERRSYSAGSYSTRGVDYILGPFCVGWSIDNFNGEREGVVTFRIGKLFWEFGWFGK